MKTHHVSLESDVVFWRVTLVRWFLTCLHPLVSPSYLGKVTARGWVPCLSSDSPKYEMTRRIIPFHRELVMQGFCCQVKDQACPQCEGGRVSVFWPVRDKAPVLPTSGLNESLIFDPSVACPTFQNQFWEYLQRNSGDGTQSKILFYQINKVFSGEISPFFSTFFLKGGKGGGDYKHLLSLPHCK